MLPLDFFSPLTFWLNKLWSEAVDGHVERVKYTIIWGNFLPYFLYKTLVALIYSNDNAWVYLVQDNEEPNECPHTVK